MIVPQFISKGDVIGITAPSAGVKDEWDVRRFENGISELESRGYRVKVTGNVFTDDGEGRSSSAEVRVKELESLLNDDDVKYIVAAKGGDYFNEMFPYLDYDLFRKHPKWIQGYSDITNLLFTVTTKCDIMTIYGSNFGDFGMKPWHKSVYESLDFVEGYRKRQDSFDFYEGGFHDRETGLEPISNDELDIWHSPNGQSVSFTGMMLGGCCDILAELVGGEHDCVFDFIQRHSEGITWYMEDYALNEKQIRRMLCDMEENGWMESVRGFLFGRPLFYEGETPFNDLMESCLSQYGVPMIFDADIGHKAPRMTVINGAVARVSLKNRKGRIDYSVDPSYNI